MNKEQCQKHSKYKGTKRPTICCLDCWHVYAEKNPDECLPINFVLEMLGDLSDELIQGIEQEIDFLFISASEKAVANLMQAFGQEFVK